MARTLNEIQNNIIADVQSIPELAQANSTSRRAIWRLWTFVQATAILLLEQIIDVFKAENDLKISKATPGTASWLIDKVFNFQYSATNPQIVQLVNFAPVYPVVDDSLKIISRCAVVSNVNNKVIVKVATQEPPVALSNAELLSLQGYVDTIGVAGIVYNCFSSNPDQLYIDADIFYDGQYSTVIQNSVNSAINSFLSKLPFNGSLKVLDLEVAIRSVVGVNDVLINNLKVRSDNVLFANGLFLVQNRTVVSRIFPTVAGYLILENSVANNLNFIAN